MSKSNFTYLITALLSFFTITTWGQTITVTSNPEVCEGITTGDLGFTIGGVPDEYSIDFDATAEGAGFVDVSTTPLPSSPLSITIPGGAAVGIYNATITVGVAGVSGGSDNFTVTINSNPDGSGLSVSVADQCQGNDHTATVTGSLANGTYTVTYDILGDNTVVGSTASLSVTGGTGGGTFIVPTADVPSVSSPAGTMLSITAITNTVTTCSTSGSLASSSNFAVHPNPNGTGLSVSVDDQCQGNDHTATVASSLADGTYTITYDISGDNSAIGSTASLSTVGGAGTFVVPTADVSNASSPAGTVLTITTITNTTTNCSTTGLSIASANFAVHPNPNSTGLSVSVADQCQGNDHTATVASSLADGTYTVTYDISGDNSATGSTASLSVTGGGGAGTFVVPTADVPNVSSPAGTMLTITEITNTATNCTTTGLSIASANFAVHSNPNGTGLSVSVDDQCQGSDHTATVTSNLVDGTYTITYNISGDNSATGSTASLSVVGGAGAGTFVVPTADVPNASNPAGTILTITEITNNVTSCTITGLSVASSNFAILPTPIGTISVNNSTICAGDDIELTFTATTGTGDYDIVVDGVSYPNVTSGNVFATLTEGSDFTGTKSFALTSITDNGVTPNCVNSLPGSSVTVTVNPLPVGTVSVNNSTICGGEDIELTFTATTGTGNYDIVVDGVSYTNVISGSVFVTLREGSDFVGTKSFALTSIIDKGVTPNCKNSSPGSSVSVTVNPIPTGTVTINNSTICAGDDVELTFTATAGTGNYDIVVDGVSYTNVVSGSVFATLTEGSDFTGTKSFALTSIIDKGVTPNCMNNSPGSSVSVTIVNPIPLGNISVNNSTICEEGTIELTFTATTGTGDYTIEVEGITYPNITSGSVFATLVESTNFTGTTTFDLEKIIDNGVGCTNNAPNNNVTVTVNPLPTAGDITGTDNVCVNSVVSLMADASGGSGGFTGYTWTVTPVSGSVTGTSTSNTLNLTGVTAGTVDVSYTVTDGNTCTSHASNTFTLTVNPLPTVDPVTAIIECNGATITQNFTGTQSPTYNWTNDNTDIGLVASGTGNLNFSATNGVNTPIVGNLVVTPTTTAGCVGASENFTITVNPTPTVEAVADFSACNGETVTVDFTSTFNVSGTTYSWTNSNTAIGLGAMGTDDLNFTATNGTNMPIMSTVTVTPSANGCDGTSESFVITVNPTPTVEPISSQELCHNTSTMAINFTSSFNVSGTTYNWTNSDPSIGLVASGTGNIPSFTGTAAGNSPSVATIEVTPIANGCPGSPESFTITVNPIPVGTVTTSSTQICEGSSIDLIFTATAGTSGNFDIFINGQSFTNVASGAIIGTYTEGLGADFVEDTTFTLGLITDLGATPTCSNPSNFSSTTVTSNETTVGTISATTTSVCEGTAVGLIFTATAGAGPYDLVVDGELFTDIESGDVFRTLTEGTHFLGDSVFNLTSITDKGATPNCVNDTVQSSVALVVNALPTADPITGTLAVCKDEITTLSANASGGAGGYSYMWSISNANASGSSITNTIDITGNVEGNVDISYIVTDANNCSSETSNIETITINPLPTVNSVTVPDYCNGATGATIVFSGDQLPDFSWTSSVDVGFLTSGNGDIPTFTASNTGTTPVTSTVVVTPTVAATGCVGATESFDVTINPTPTVTDPADQVVCHNFITNEIIFTGTVSGTTYDWTNNTPSIGLSAGSSGNISAFLGQNTGTVPVNATVTVVPTVSATSCVGTSETFTITVNPIPTVNTIGDATYCNGEPGTAVNFTGAVLGTTYDWNNSPNVNIGFGTIGTGDIADFTASNATSTIQTITVSVTPTANACVGEDENFTIKVNPTPTIDAVSNQVLCTGDLTNPISFSSVFNVSGTTYHWTNNNTNIGLAASGVGNISAFTTTNTTDAPLIATITVTPKANGCDGAVETFTITVNPTPTVDVVSDQIVCNNELTSAVNFSSGFDVFGTIYHWTNNNTAIGLGASGTGDISVFTATNSTNLPITGTITITPEANGCFGSSKTFTITVNPTPTVNSVSNATYCNGVSGTSIGFSGGVSGTVFTWTSSTNVGFGTSNTGNINSYVATNSATSPITANVSVVPSALSCTGVAESFNITVNPTPTVVDPADQIVVNDSMTTDVIFTGGVPGTTYSWTNNNVSIGLTGTGTGTISAFQASNPDTIPEIATITVTPLANGCTGSTSDFTITVNPTGTVINISDQVYCNNDTTTSIVFEGGVSGTTFSWTNDNTDIGLVGSGDDSIGVFKIINTTNAPITATIVVTPTTNGNPGEPTSFTYTVNPTPTVDALSNVIYCNGETGTVINFEGDVSGTTYNWNSTVSTLGFGGSGTNSIPVFTATNATNTPITSIIKITPSANQCIGDSTTFDLTVNPTPTVDEINDQTLCNGESTVAVNFSSIFGVVGTTYEWENDKPSIGLAANGSGNIPSFPVSNTTNAPITATITVTPKANNCEGIQKTFTILVNPTPTVDIDVNNNQTVCNGDLTTPISFTSLFGVTGTTYEWTNDNTSIGLVASGSNDIGAFSANNPTNAPITATITVTPKANGCSGTAKIFTITVNPTPTVDMPTSQVVCNTEFTTSVNFTSSFGVAGTTYNWTNDNTSIGLGANGTGNISGFQATNATNAPITANITVTPQAGGCLGTSKVFTIIVNPTPTVDVVASQTICNGGLTPAFNFTSSFNVANTSYSWTNDNTNIGLAANGTGNIGAFAAANTTNAPITATITVTPTANSCTGASNTFTITVNPTPDVESPTSQTVCNGEKTSLIEFVTGTGVIGTSFNWSNANPSIGLAGSGSGNILPFSAVNETNTPIITTLLVTPTANTCAGAIVPFTIIVNPTPTVNTISDQVICNESPITPIVFSSDFGVAGTNYNWTNDNNSIGLNTTGTGAISAFTAINSDTLQTVANIVVTPVVGATGCSGLPESFSISVNPSPTVDIVPNQVVGNTSSTANIIFTGNVPNTTYNWANDNITIGLGASGSNSIPSFTGTNNDTIPNVATITVTTINTLTQCVGEMTDFTITVNPTGTVVNVPDQVYCNGETTSAIVFSGGVSGTTFNWTNDNTDIGLAASGTGDIASFSAANATSAPISATIVVTPITPDGKSGIPGTFTFIVNPTPTVNVQNDLIYCNGEQGTAITFGGNVSGTTYNWSGTVSTLGFGGSGTNDIPIFTATNLINTPTTSIITVTPSANQCVGNADNFSITVNPTPTVDDVNDQTLCNGELTTAINFSSIFNVTGTAYNWINDNTSIGLAANGTGNIAPFLAINTTNAPITATITVTPKANDCEGLVKTFTITVKPTPTVDVVQSQIKCAGESTNTVNFTSNFNVSGTNYSYVSTNSTIGVAPSGTGNINTFITTNATNVPVVSNITVTPSANSCLGDPESFSITVNPIPTVDSIENQVVCNGETTTAVNFLSSFGVANTDFDWINNNTSIGLPASGVGDISAFTAINTTNAAVTATITVLPTTSSDNCDGIVKTFTITVNPTPEVDIVTDQIVCNNENTKEVIFSSTFGVSGTSYSWTNTNTSTGLTANGISNIGVFVASNSTNIPVTTTVEVTPSANGCVGLSEDFLITVNPTPTVDAPVNQTICDGDLVAPINFTSTFGVSGTSYSWTNDNVGIGLATNGVGNISSFTASNITTLPLDATITIISEANACLGNPVTFDISVNPTPTVNSITDFEYCNGDNGVAINFTGDVSGTTYEWVSSANVGFGLSGTGNIPVFNAANSSSTITTATVTVTPVREDCIGIPITFTITVNPTPNVVVTPSSQVVQNDSTTTDIIFSSDVVGATYAWQSNTSSIGLPTLGQGNITGFQAINTDTIPVTATLTVTPTANTCTGAPETFTITVNPTGTVNGLVNQVVCNNDMTLPTNFVETVSGTTFNWTNDEPSIGLAETGTGDISSFIATNTTNLPIIATITVVPEVGGVFGDPQTFTITVNPTPTVNLISDAVYCNNAIGNAINFTGNILGETYSWTCSENIGFGLNGTGNIGGFTAINSTSVPKIATIQVIPRANNCDGTIRTFTITVNPTPSVSALANATYCNNTVGAPMTFTGSVAGTSYNWTSSQDVGFGSSNTGNISSFTAVNSTNAPKNATITIVPSANSCIGNSESFTITVNPTPTVDASVDQVVCNDAFTSAVNFTSSFGVSNTTYSWVNDNSNIGLTASGTNNISAFNATNISNVPITGIITITPSANSCVGASKQLNITVNPTPTVDPVANQVLCEGDLTSVVQLNSTFGVAGTIYNWTNDNVSIGLSSSTGTGNIPPFITTNPSNSANTANIVIAPSANGCVGNTTSFSVKVNPTPDVTKPADVILCNEDISSAIIFTSSLGVAGTTYSWTNNNTGIGLAASGVGNIANFAAINTTATAQTATITVTPRANNCDGIPQTFTITVNSTPTIDIPNDIVVCQGESIVIPNFASSFGVSGTTYSWTNNNTSIGLPANGTGNIAEFTAVNTGNAPATATIQVTPNANGCDGITKTFTIIVNPIPTVNKPNDVVICNGESTSLISFATNFGVLGTAYSWTNDNTNIGLPASGVGNIPSFLATNTSNASVVATITVTPDANNCDGIPQTFTITVHPTPTVNAITVADLCAGDMTNPINFTSSNNVLGTTYSWTNNNTNIGLEGSDIGNIPSFVAENFSNAPITGTVLVTPHANGCSGTSKTFSITVNPTPIVNSVANSSFCDGEAVQEITFTSTTAGIDYAWANNNTNIGLGSSGLTKISPFTAFNTSNTTINSTISVTPTANGCNGTAKTFTITVHPTPIVNAVADQSVCNGTQTTPINFSGNLTNAVYQWSNNNTGVGLIANGLGNIAPFTTTNSTNGTDTAVITVTAFANGCMSTSESVAIFVEPAPSVDAVADTVICNAETIPLIDFMSSFGVSNVTYDWTNDNSTIGLGANGVNDIPSFVATNTTNAPVQANITVVPSSSTSTTCLGTSMTFAITVNPTPTVADPVDWTVCNNEQIPGIIFSSVSGNHVVGTVYDWGNNNTAISLPTSGVGNIAAFAATNTSTTASVATINVTPIANSCLGTLESFTITVNPTPTVNSLADDTLCSGTMTTPVNFASAVNGTNFNWTNTNSMIGLAANGNGNISAFVASTLPGSNSPALATITVTPEAANCFGTPETYDITVNPIPSVNQEQDQAVCHGELTNKVVFSSSIGITGTTYNWINDQPSISTIASTGTDSIPVFSGINTTSQPIVATFTVTPTANSCSGPLKTFTITVNPIPTVDAIQDQTLCTGESTNLVQFSSALGVPGTAYSWTNDNTITGLNASGNGNIMVTTLTNTSSMPEVSTINVTPMANNCQGVSESFIITVNPKPTVDQPTDITVCDGEEVMEIVFTSSFGVLGTAYDWTNDNTGIGLGGSGTGNIPFFDATNTDANTIIGVIQVTPTANNCIGDIKDFEISVNPKPAITSVVAPAVMNSKKAFSIEVITDIDNSIQQEFDWTSVLDNVKEAANGIETENPLSQTLLLENEFSNGNVDYSVVVIAEGCESLAHDFSVQVVPEANAGAGVQILAAPNTFTPNGDGVNETWELVYLGSGNPQEIIISIYNRSGAKIHEMRAIDTWDGTISAGGVVDGAYFFIAENPDGEQQRGTVTIIR